MSNEKSTAKRQRTTQKASAKFAKGVNDRMEEGTTAGLVDSIAKKAANAIDSQISGLKYQLTEKEAALEAAEAKLNEAIYPTSDITNAKAYCQNIANAQMAVDAAEADLVATEDSLAYFEALKKERF